MTYVDLTTCPKCGRVTLPTIWDGTIPPSCTTCGYQEPSSGGDYNPFDNDYNGWPVDYEIYNIVIHKKRILDKIEKLLDKLLEE